MKLEEVGENGRKAYFRFINSIFRFLYPQNIGLDTKMTLLALLFKK